MTVENERPWLRTSEAVVALGMSRETLMRRRTEGYYTEGEHWIATGPYPTSAVLWNIEACRNRQSHWEMHQRQAHGGVR